jgi:hypothetical protein
MHSKKCKLQINIWQPLANMCILGFLRNTLVFFSLARVSIKKERGREWHVQNLFIWQIQGSIGGEQEENKGSEIANKNIMNI